MELNRFSALVNVCVCLCVSQGGLKNDHLALNSMIIEP